jgi:hypothetical protein
VLVLAIGLLALVPLVGTSSSFSPDEPVAITQARSLANGGGWIVEHPFPEVDPESTFYPLAGSSHGTDGVAPFAKHPVYPMMLAALEPVGGLGAMMIPSVLATVAAAALAALLAREVAEGLERPVLWAVGVGSPLLFDAYLVIAHSLGASFVTAATLAVVVAIRRSRSLRLMMAAALLVSVAVLFRTEALIFALALSVATAVVGITRRRHGLVVGGAVVAAAGVGSALLEKWLQQLFIGAGPQAISVPDAGGNFFEARWAGFLNTWLSPSSSSDVSGGDALLVIVMLLAVAAIAVLRWRSNRPQLLVFLGAGATGLAFVALLTDPDRVVPGLLVAFPLAVFAIGLASRDSFRDPARLVLTVTVGLFMAGVLATQYGAGGSAEWGGRYFALGVPIMTVLAVDGLARRAPALPVPVRRWAGAGLVTCSLLLAGGAIASLASMHRHNERLLDRLVSSSQLISPGDGGAPVVVSAWPNIARHAWPTTPDQRWLYSADDEGFGAELASRLVGAGVTELTFVGQEAEELSPYLGHYAIDEERSYVDGRWEMSVLVARGDRSVPSEY